jgi:hypothetical protein
MVTIGATLQYRDWAAGLAGGHLYDGGTASVKPTASLDGGSPSVAPSRIIDCGGPTTTTLGSETPNAFQLVYAVGSDAQHAALATSYPQPTNWLGSANDAVAVLDYNKILHLWPIFASASKNYGSAG